MGHKRGTKTKEAKTEKKTNKQIKKINKKIVQINKNVRGVDQIREWEKGSR